MPRRGAALSAVGGRERPLHTEAALVSTVASSLFDGELSTLIELFVGARLRDVSLFDGVISVMDGVRSDDAMPVGTAPNRCRLGGPNAGCAEEERDKDFSSSASEGDNSDEGRAAADPSKG